MHNQPKFYPQRGSDFYADGRSVRPQVAETVARNQLHENGYFYTGLTAGKEGDGMPFPVTMDVLERGQERYNVYCTPCHSRVGNGVGMIVERGYSQAGNLHSVRLQGAPLGHFFNVISNGYGAMPDYSAQITPADRWAVTAYIRALQLSQQASQSDVASGAHVEPLSAIVEREGLPQGFASDWALPPTATPATVLPDGATPTSQGGANTGQPSTAVPSKPAAAPTSPPATSSAEVSRDNHLAPATNTAGPHISTAALVKSGAGQAAAGSAAAGHELYVKNCQMCHQASMSGMPPAIPSLLGVVDRVGADRVRNQIHNGAPPMPAFPNLTPTDLDNLVAYLAQNSKSGTKGGSAVAAPHANAARAALTTR